MRIDGAKGIKSWLRGFFSGSFQGYLEGTASHAVTASYVDDLYNVTELRKEVQEIEVNLDDLAYVPVYTPENVEVDNPNTKIVASPLVVANNPGDLPDTGTISTRGNAITVYGRVRALGSLEVEDKIVSREGELTLKGVTLKYNNRGFLDFNFDK